MLENAAQYSTAGTTIRLNVDVTSDELVLTVRDYGPGVATAELPHLFDRFYRGAASKGRVAGTGMGLSIARGMLAAEGGGISVENCQDGGAVFRIAIAADRRVASLESAS